MGWRSAYALGTSPVGAASAYFTFFPAVAFAVSSLDASTLVILICRCADVGGSKVFVCKTSELVGTCGSEHGIRVSRVSMAHTKES